MAGATVSLLPTGTKQAEVSGNGLQREPFRVESLAWCETQACAAQGRGLAAVRPRRHHPTSFARFPSRALVDGNEARDQALAPMIETILNGQPVVLFSPEGTWLRGGEHGNRGLCALIPDRGWRGGVVDVECSRAGARRLAPNSLGGLG